MIRIMCALVVATMAVNVPMAPGLELGKSVGPVNLVTLSGEPRVMDNYRRQAATAVLFLSGRCDVTDKSIADINQLHETYRARDVLFVGVCSNSEESGDELRTFSQRRGIIFPVYINQIESRDGGQTWTKTVPTTLHLQALCDQARRAQ